MKIEKQPMRGFPGPVKFKKWSGDVSRAGWFKKIADGRVTRLFGIGKIANGRITGPA
ncbi:hypothetical protein [Maribellus maritimus]|uniref:hypothetical protein n=1 Tax=Maribellus maritimus TaxID=2870838 RepID=UPI001EEAB289|nr:hypothetical protein [Maribellus maritimus]MCG6190884.1 hypothetical protein [Maribellus maritimus]